MNPARGRRLAAALIAGGALLLWGCDPHKGTPPPKPSTQAEAPSSGPAR